MAALVLCGCLAFPKSGHTAVQRACAGPAALFMILCRMRAARSTREKEKLLEVTTNDES